MYVYTTESERVIDLKTMFMQLISLIALYIGYMRFYTLTATHGHI